MLRIRQVEPADHAEWLALRTTLWPDENAAEPAVEVARFFAEPSAQSGAMLEAVLVAIDSDEPAPGRGVGRALVAAAEAWARARRRIARWALTK